jgi:hypothetical protein
MAENNEHEVFIDADAGFASDKNSYETIIINHISACAKILSREMTGGQIVHKSSNTGTEKYVEDVRELVINHVDVLEALLGNWIKDNNLKQLNIIKTEIDNYKIKILNREMLVEGKGFIKLSNIGLIPADHSAWKEFVNFKALRYREIFRILVQSYNDEKAEIRSLEEE